MIKRVSPLIFAMFIAGTASAQTPLLLYDGGDHKTFLGCVVYTFQGDVLATGAAISASKRPLRNRRRVGSRPSGLRCATARPR